MTLSVILAIAVALYLNCGLLHYKLMRFHNLLLGHVDDLERAEIEGPESLHERAALLLVKGVFVVFWPLVLTWCALASADFCD